VIHKQLFRNWLLVSFSFFIGLIFIVLPFSNSLQAVKPDILLLLLIFWTLILPKNIGVITGFLLGLFVDLLKGHLLGQSAISLSLIAFFTRLLRGRLRTFQIWQQAFIILMLLLAEKLISSIFALGLGMPIDYSLISASIFSNLLFWPVLYLIMRAYQYRFNLH